jgi:hypothetical protein
LHRTILPVTLLDATNSALQLHKYNKSNILVQS